MKRSIMDEAWRIHRANALAQAEQMFEIKKEHEPSRLPLYVREGYFQDHPSERQFYRPINELWTPVGWLKLKSLPEGA